MNVSILESLIDLQKKIDSGQGTSRPEGNRAALGEEEELPVDHLTLKNPLDIQVHLLVKGKEEGTIGIALKMDLGKLNLLHLMVK